MASWLTRKMASIGLAELDGEVRDNGHAEVRAPKATRAYTWVNLPNQPLQIEWDAERAFVHGYFANLYVFRCVEVISRNLAGLPFRAGEDPEKPNNYDPNAPLARFLGPPPYGPNPVTSSRRLWQNAIAQYLVTGRFAWELETAPGSDQVVALWPLASRLLRPINAKGGAQWFKEFKYGTQGVDEITYKPDQLLYVWRPSAKDWRQPETVLQAAGIDVSIAVMQDRYDYAFLNNDQVPAAVVVTEAFADEAERQAFRDQFRSEHGGPENAGKVAFAEAEFGEDGKKISETLAVQQLGLSHRESRAVERYSQKTDAILEAFGVPRSKVGDASGRTFANAEQEDHNFWHETMLPLIREVEDEINQNLAPRFGSHVGWFDTRKVRALMPPKITALVGVPALVHGGIMTKNEARKEYQLPEVDDPDADRLGIDGEIEINVAAREKAITKMLDRQEAGVLARLNGKRGRQDPLNVFNRAYWDPETRDVLDIADASGEADGLVQRVDEELRAAIRAGLADEADQEELVERVKAAFNLVRREYGVV